MEDKIGKIITLIKEFGLYYLVCKKNVHLGMFLKFDVT
jgi:hypothetical protein